MALQTRTTYQSANCMIGTRQGIQDVKSIPSNLEGAALATAVGLGQVWIIHPHRTNSSGNQGVTEMLYNLGDKARNVVAI
jgi:hypothetical protein